MPPWRGCWRSSTDRSTRCSPPAGSTRPTLTAEAQVAVALGRALAPIELTLALLRGAARALPSRSPAPAVVTPASGHSTPTSCSSGTTTASPSPTGSSSMTSSSASMPQHRWPSARSDGRRRRARSGNLCHVARGCRERRTCARRPRHGRRVRPHRGNSSGVPSARTRPSSTSAPTPRPAPRLRGRPSTTPRCHSRSRTRDAGFRVAGRRRGRRSTPRLERPHEHPGARGPRVHARPPRAPVPGPSPRPGAAQREPAAHDARSSPTIPSPDRPRAGDASTSPAPGAALLARLDLDHR